MAHRDSDLVARAARPAEPRVVSAFLHGTRTRVFRADTMSTPNRRSSRRAARPLTRGSQPHRLALPVRQRSPAPFQRPELKMANPDRAGDQLEDPRRADNIVQLISLQLAVHLEAVAGEYDRANHGLKYVVAESHLSHRA